MARGSGTIFIGNLPGDVREREVEDLFYKYGRIVAIDLKTPPRPPAFCFLEYDDPRDAQDAVTGRDNYDFHGNRLRVELAHGARSRGGGGGGGHDRGGGGGYDRGGDRGGYDRGGDRGGGYGNTAAILDRSRAKGSAYRAIVKGLPASASWQDLKDHFRKVVKPSYTNVVRDRGGAMGIVEFDSADDLDRAIRKLDDTEFRNPFDRSYIRIIEDDGGRGGGSRRGRSRSRSRSRARSYSRSRSPSDSRSRSRSAASRSRSRSKSKSKSRSRSPASKSRSRSASPARDDDDDVKPAEDDEPAPETNGRSPSPED